MREGAIDVLWFVGLGTSGFDSIPNGALDVLAKADMVYLEQFTSPIGESEIARIRDAVSGRLVLVKRWQVEDGTEILKSAKDNMAVLLSYGDPFVATTHTELRTRSAEQGIKTGCIHAASAVTAMVGECGLHFYKIGRQATIMSEAKSLTTPYYVTYRNMIHGNHTVLLLEYNQDRGFFLEPGDALAALARTEEGQARNVMTPSTYCIVASRIGSKSQSIVAGMSSSLQRANFGEPPHAIIVPGSMHFTESDALKRSARCMDEPLDNTGRLKSIPHQMLEKYVPMVREAIEEVRPYCKSAGSLQVLENADLYVRDAEKFLADGHGEVAVLSIGYADGLVDALMITNGLGPKM